MEDTNQPTLPAENQPARLPFDVEFMQRGESFCNAAIAAIPELQGIALIPLWSAQPENVPAGLLSLRNTEPPFASALLLLLRRLSIFSGDVHKDLIGQLRMLDQYAGHLAEQLNQHKEELNKLAPDAPNAQQG
jgi:hypothetical protein